MSLLLDLSRFRGTTDRIARQVNPADLSAEGDDFRITAPAELDVELDKDAQRVRLVGRVATTLSTDCSRCLDAFDIPVDARFDTLFLPVSANAGEAEREVRSEDLGVSFYRDDTIDLAEVMREQFLLALP